MNLEDTADVFGNSIFCDDIRQEMDGKVSFIGVYRTRMFVYTEFPITLPKFGLSVNFSQRREQFTTNLKLWMFLPGDPEDAPSIMGDLSGPADEITEQAKDEEKSYINLQMNLMFAQLKINQPGTIKVRMVCNDKLYRLGTLGVIKSAAPLNSDVQKI